MPSSRGDGAVTSLQECSYIRYLFPVLICFNEIYHQCLERDGFCVHRSCWLSGPLVEERFTPGDILH